MAAAAPSFHPGPAPAPVPSTNDSAAGGIDPSCLGRWLCQQKPINDNQIYSKCAACLIMHFRYATTCLFL